MDVPLRVNRGEKREQLWSAGDGEPASCQLLFATELWWLGGGTLQCLWQQEGGWRSVQAGDCYSSEQDAPS